MADGGELTADELNQLGMNYYWGDGVEIDLHRSAYYYEQAAKAGHVDAMYSTGLNYGIGCGVPLDMEKCLNWLNKAADNGHLPAMDSLGYIYYSGDGVAKDYQKSLSYFERGIACGCPYCMADAARQYERGEGTKKDAEKAKELYERAHELLYKLAVEDDHKAQLWIGRWYYDGCELIGVNTDYVQAVSWFRKAAEDGIPNAQNMLGICYEYGLGVIQDYAEAARQYSKAMEKQEPVAICNLARLFYNGKGVEQDDKKAAELFNLAANLGYGDAQASIGYCYLKGTGVEKDERKAVHWFRKAMEKESEWAYDNLAECYMKGVGMEKDEHEGFRMYCRGADLGNLNSRVMVAQCYIEGRGTPKDCAKACSILEALCYEIEDYGQKSTIAVFEDNRIYNPFDKNFLKHYAKAYYLLATLKNAGCGTAKDTSGAIRLLRLADKYGYKDEERPKDTAQRFIDKILAETAEYEVEDTVRSRIEVRDLGNWKKGQMCRYAFTIHHTDGSSSDIRFKTQRNKFVYLLSLLFAYNSRSAGVMARFFAMGRELLVRLAKEAAFDVHDQGTWIDEYVYKEVYVADVKKYHYEYSNTRYSIAVSQANDYLREACSSEEENKTFCLKTTGGRESMASIAVAANQIILPPLLARLSEELPTTDDLLNYRQPTARPIDYGEYLRLQQTRQKGTAQE